jgi:O-antigen ligase
MRLALMVLVAILIVADVFQLELSLGPGLSLKNALLYVLFMGLFFRTIIEGVRSVDMPAVHAGFLVLVGYAILTWLMAGLLIEYDGYDLIDSAISLKSELADFALLFLVAFHGTRNLNDVRALLIALAVAFGLANLLSLAHVAGVIDLGIRIGDNPNSPEAGRVFGVFGHANETGTLITALLPMSVAVGLATRGLARVLLLTLALASATMLLMTVSRGAFVGLIVGCAWAAFLCRRIIPMSRLIAIGVTAAAFVGIALVVALVLNPDFAHVIADRILGQSRAIDVGEASSGRTEIWGSVLERMAMVPVTLLTGYGWDVYHTMPFRYVPHNYYLTIWFNLGLPGLIAFIVIMTASVRAALRAAPLADERMRVHLIAFPFGFLSLAVGIFFTDMFEPWLYVWFYAGVLLKGAALVLAEHAESVPAAAPAIRRIQEQNWRAGRRAY